MLDLKWLQRKIEEFMNYWEADFYIFYSTFAIVTHVSIMLFPMSDYFNILKKVQHFTLLHTVRKNLATIPIIGTIKYVLFTLDQGLSLYV